PVQHQRFADALATEAMTDQANPKFPILRHILLTLAPVAEAADVLPCSLTEQRNCGSLIAACDLRPSGIAEKPSKLRTLKATNRRIRHIVAAKFGQEYRDL